MIGILDHLHFKLRIKNRGLHVPFLAGKRVFRSLHGYLHLIDSPLESQSVQLYKQVSRQYNLLTRFEIFPIQLVIFVEPFDVKLILLVFLGDGFQRITGLDGILEIALHTRAIFNYRLNG